MYLKDKLSLSHNGGVQYHGSTVAPNNAPVLVVGLGGTGIDALLRIKHEVQTRMPACKDSKGNIVSLYPSNIAFLAIDTDRELFRKTHGTAELDYFSEYVDISVENLREAIQNIPNTEEWNWFDRDLIHQHYYAAGIRQIGRFEFFLNTNKIVDRFMQTIDKVLEASSDSYRSNLKIFITTGIGGGTGAGIFLDTAYILRTLALQRTPNVEMHGYIFTPDLNMGDKPLLYRNGFASLKELDHWMSFNEHRNHFVQSYNNHFKIDCASAPFDFCHIVTSQDSECHVVTYNEAIDKVANTVFSFIEHGTVRHIYGNVAGHIFAANKPFPANYGYLSIGYDKFEIPYTEITTLVAARVFKKLEPVFQNEPTKELFDTDMYKLELTPYHLEKFIEQDIEKRPIQGARERYADIWPNNLPYNKAERWLEHVKETMNKNRINFVSVKEGLLSNYMHVILKDISRGPCYAARLLFSNTSFCIIKTLEGFRENRQGAVANLVAKAGPLKTKMEQTYMSGRNAGVFGKSNAAKEYMEAFSGWLRNEYDYIMYSELVDAIEDLIVRLKKYYDRIFKNLMDALCMLSEISDENIRFITVKENEARKMGTNSSTYLIRPLGFEAKYREDLTKRVDRIEETFLAGLNENLERFVGIDMASIDSDILASSDTEGFISEFINENFHDILSTGIETVLEENMPLAAQDIKNMLDILEHGSLPLLKHNILYTLDTQTFSLISIPNDCSKIFSVANRANKPITDLPIMSNERSKIEWIKVTAGIPLFALPLMSEMEVYYEDAMNTSIDARMGIHLHYEWREQLPSPLPESTWSAAVVNSPEKAFTKAYNERIRNAFDKCVETGIIKTNPGENWATLYVDGEASIKMMPSGTNFHESLLEQVRENVLRFHNISQMIIKQAEKLENTTCS